MLSDQGQTTFKGQTLIKMEAYFTFTFCLWRITLNYYFVQTWSGSVSLEGRGKREEKKPICWQREWGQKAFVTPIVSRNFRRTTKIYGFIQLLHGFIRLNIIHGPPWIENSKKAVLCQWNPCVTIIMCKSKWRSLFDHNVTYGLFFNKKGYVTWAWLVRSVRDFISVSVICRFHNDLTKNEGILCHKHFPIIAYGNLW